MPEFKNGKVSYMQIPAGDVEATASFYQTTVPRPGRKRHGIWQMGPRRGVNEG